MCEECRFVVEDACACPNNIDNFGKRIDKIEVVHCDYMHHEICENNMSNNTSEGLDYD